MGGSSDCRLDGDISINCEGSAWVEALGAENGAPLGYSYDGIPGGEVEGMTAMMELKSYSIWI